MKTPKALVLALSVFTAALTQSPAAIIVEAPSALPGSFQITNDITFTINATGSAQYFVLDEWVVFDGSANGTPIFPNLSYAINGGAPVTQAGQFDDNLGFIFGSITANDGVFFINAPVSVVPGNTITAKSGLYALGASPDFNPRGTQTFKGNMFVADISGNRLSPNVSVPEPTALGLLGLGALALLRRRR